MGFFRGIKNIGRGIESLFRGGRNPADNARQFLEPVAGYGREAYNPFIQQGREAYNALSPEYIKMLQNPAEYYNQEIAGYEPSAQYKYAEPLLTQIAENSASAAGRLGSDDDQRARAEMVQALLNADIGNYLENIRGIRGTGMEGLESATGRGFQGAGSLADYLGTAATNRANLEYAGKAQQGMNKSSFLNSLLKAAATGAGAYYGGRGQMPGTTLPQGSQSQIGNQDLSTIQTRLPYSPEMNYGIGGYRGGRR